MLNHKNMHIQKPFPCEKYVTNTTIKSLPPRFSSPLPFLLFAQPWPPFSFWNRNKVILGPIWNKDNLFTFHNLENAIWKNSLRFVSALILLMWSLCLPNANWHLCVVHRPPSDRTTTSGRSESPECFSLSIFFGKSNQQAPLVWLSHSSLKFIYSLLIDLINCWLIIVIYHFDLLIDFHIISIYWLIYIVIDYCDDYFDWFAWHFLG